MNKTMKRVTLFLALLFSAALLHAENLRVAHIFSDHMVLQRESTVPVWGWGEPGAKVTVATNWNGKKVETRVASDGTWRVIVDTRASKESTSLKMMTIKSGKATITLNDVLLGEVWICAGQSNMEMPLRGFGYQSVEGAMDAIMEAGSTARDIRVLDIKTGKQTSPVDDIEAVWELSTPGVAAKCSAVGYFFAKRLNKALGCPVGIIVNAWGGSRIEPWMTCGTIDDSGLNEIQLGVIYSIEEQDDCWPETPELIWNGRMAPIVGYGIRGFLWYQGCSNMGQPDCYDILQNAMVRFWREQWGYGDLPFIYALLAPYAHGDADGRWRPFFVEDQMKTADAIPAAWYVPTETLGHKDTIHPAKKREIADMMCLRALQNVYGMSLGIDIEAPLLESVQYQEDGSAQISLTHVWSDLGSVYQREITGFEMAGEDRVFHLAEAEVNKDGTVTVRCAEVPHPVAIRYGWRNWMGANLSKTNGIPVPPFRTDDWEY